MYLQWQTPEHLRAMQASPKLLEIARRFGGKTQFESYLCDVVHVTEV